MFTLSSRANFTPDRSIPLESVRGAGSSYTRLLPLGTDHADENDSNSITNYELGFEDEPRFSDDSSYCSESSSMLERRVSAMAFGIMFPVSLVFGGCLRKTGKKLKRKLMTRFGKKAGRGTCRRQADENNAGPFGDHHEIDGPNALSTGIDRIPSRSSMEISSAPVAPYRPLRIADINDTKREWKKTNAKQEWRRRRTAMVDNEL